MTPEVNHRKRDDKKGWRNRGKRNGSRGGAFRRFLVDTFGDEKLRGGSGVLDVAGGGAGGGGLAFQLMNYCNIPATVVDPRAPDYKKTIDRLTYSGPAASPCPPVRTRDAKGAPPRLPRFVLRKVMPPQRQRRRNSFVESAAQAATGDKQFSGRARHKPSRDNCGGAERGLEQRRREGEGAAGEGARWQHHRQHREGWPSRYHHLAAPPQRWRQPTTTPGCDRGGEEIGTSWRGQRGG